MKRKNNRWSNRLRLRWIEYLKRVCARSPSDEQQWLTSLENSCRRELEPFVYKTADRLAYVNICASSVWRQTTNNGTCWPRWFIWTIRSSWNLGHGLGLTDLWEDCLCFTVSSCLRRKGGCNWGTAKESAVTSATHCSVLTASYDIYEYVVGLKSGLLDSDFWYNLNRR